jgi:hypothetical protein
LKQNVERETEKAADKMIRGLPGRRIFEMKRLPAPRFDHFDPLDLFPRLHRLTGKRVGAAFYFFVRLSLGCWR